MTLYAEQELKAPNFEAIPQELKQHPKWMMWKAEPTEKDPNVMGKVPYHVNGYRGAKDNPKHWITFEQAKRTFEKGGFDGIGVVINRNDFLVCVDLDGFKNMNDIPAEKYNLTIYSYTEYSPSGTGLHIWIRGQKPVWCGTKNKEKGIEVFGSEKEAFVTITGDKYNDLPVMAHQGLINMIAEKYFSKDKPNKHKNKKVINFNNYKKIPDEEVLKKMFNSQNGQKLLALFKGDISDYTHEDGSPDPSAADMAFCTHLAYWTNNDPEQMDRLFRRSALYRKKWDEKRPPNSTYGRDTMEKGIRLNESLGNGFDPKGDVDPEPTEKKEHESDPAAFYEDWRTKLETKNNGSYRNNAYNILLIFENDENLKGKFALNCFSNEIEIVGKVPWERSSDLKSISNYDDACLRNYFSIHYGIQGKETINGVLMEIVNKNKFHPVKKYLNAQRGKWDGVPRIKKLFCTFFDSDDTELTHEITRLFFAGAIKRIMEPGCKFDYVLTLKGDQGLGKSSFFRKLTINPMWFDDSLEDLGGKEAKEHIQGIWILELGEMSAVSKGEAKKYKQFITSQFDRVRLPYEKRSVMLPRQCIFTATTNEGQPLKDDTGGRRWWILDVRSKWYEKDIDFNDHYINQLWAEAIEIYDHMERENIPYKLPDHLEELARVVQHENTQYGIFKEELEMHLDRGFYFENTVGGAREVHFDRICARFAWEVLLCRYSNEMQPHHARTINAIIKNHKDYKPIGRRNFDHYGKVETYERIIK